MPSGTSDSPLTTKTEFARYLDANPSGVPALRGHLKLYRKTMPEGTSFGFWMRSRHLPVFAQAYAKWWLKHPQLFGKVYKDAGNDLLAVSFYRA